MALITRILGHGPTNNGTVTSLYTVQANILGALVSNLRIVNTGSAAMVNLFFRPNAGSQVRIHTKDYLLPAGDILVVKPDLTMGTADAIEVTTAVPMEFIMFGVEKE